MAHRLPTSAGGSFDDDLSQGRNLVTTIDPSRWELDRYFNPDKSNPGTAYSLRAGTIGDIRGFDAEFFGISPREAAQMDPQQRLLLELAWELFENAGVPASSLRGTQTGVYLGIANLDYSLRMTEDLPGIDSSTATGNTASVAANRLSYYFDLRGPSMALDTACSSSLVAFHLACQAIRNGELQQTVTGGITLHAHPYGFVLFSKSSMLSPSGYCNVFDGQADGYVRSEGGGLFLLKDYDLAVRDGNKIHAVVAESMVNTDGKKSGITVPRAETQSALLSSVYAKAGIAVERIDYIEAHGTGTPVGDPVEALAIGRAVGTMRPKDQPVLIGSVKSNVGHLEAASGIAGLVKAMYVIRHREIPPTIGIKKLNENIDFEGLNLKVVTQTVKLDPGSPIVVGVNSFGFGGSNAHVVLTAEKASCEVAAAPHADTEAGLTFVLSGRSPAALVDYAKSIRESIKDASDRSLYDIAYQLFYRRDWLNYRSAFRATSVQSAIEHLTGVVASSGDMARAGDDLVFATVDPKLPVAGPVFFYSGNGSQWDGMGRELLAEPVFLEAIKSVDAYFVPLAGFSILAEFRGESGVDRYRKTSVAQPALFALQVGLTCLLRAQGVTATAIAGHSVGEIAAAWAAGILELSDAVCVIYHRSRLQETTRHSGGMTAINADSESVRALLTESRHDGEIHIAADNSHRGCTIAGPIEPLDSFEQVLVDQNIAYRRLDLDYAFHSPVLDSIRSELIASLADIRPAAGNVPYYSSVTGARLDGVRADAEYWWHNIRDAVLFRASSCAAIHDFGEGQSSILVEIGPSPVLRRYLLDSLKECDAPGEVIDTLRTTHAGTERVSAAALKILLCGATLDRSRHFPVEGVHTRLPNYPWQKVSHWHDMSPESTSRLTWISEHPLLGSRRSKHDLQWEQHIDLGNIPFLADHVVGEGVIFPGSGYVELAFAAARAWRTESVIQVEDLDIIAPLSLGTGNGRVVRVSIDPADARVSIRSRQYNSDEAWTLHAQGRIVFNVGMPTPEFRAPATSGTPDFDRTAHLSLAERAGLQYGPAFQAVQCGWIDGPSITAALTLPDAIAGSITSYLLHPALLDAAFQLIIELVSDWIGAYEGVAFIPTQLGCGSYQQGRGVPARAEIKRIKQSPHSLLLTASIFDASGSLIAHFSNVRFKRITLRRAASLKPRFLHESMVPAPMGSANLQSTVDQDDVLNALHAFQRRVASDPNHRRFVDELDPLLDTVCGQFADEALTRKCAGSSTEAWIESVRQESPELTEYAQFLIRTLEFDDRLDHGSDKFASDPNSLNNDLTAQDLWNSLLSEYPDYSHAVRLVGLAATQNNLRFVDSTGASSTKPSVISLSKYWNQLLGHSWASGLLRTLRTVLLSSLSRLPDQLRLGILEVGAFEPRLGNIIGSELDPTRHDFIFASSDTSALERASELCSTLHCLSLLPLGGVALPVEVFASLPDSSADMAIVWLDAVSHSENIEALDAAILRLKPGATVVLAGIHHSRWLDFVFGASADWWESHGNLSPLSAMRPVTYWIARLKQRGLQVTEPSDSDMHTIASGGYVILATKPVPLSPPLMVGAGSPKRWLLLRSGSPSSLENSLADDLAASLQRQGDFTTFGNPADPQALERQIGSCLSSYGALDGIILLAGIGKHDDAAATATPTRCSFAANILLACERSACDSPIFLLTCNVHADVLAKPVPMNTGRLKSMLDDAALAGFGRSLANEAPDNRIHIIDICLCDAAQANSLVQALAFELSACDDEVEVTIDGTGARYAPRILQGHGLRQHKLPRSSGQVIPLTPDPARRLIASQPGQLRNLQWEDVPHGMPGENEVEVEVHASGLNFRDVMYAIGLLPDEAIEAGFTGPSLGMEFSGRIVNVGAFTQGFAPGDHVVGFGSSCFSNRLIANAAAIAHVPAHISLTSAATIPTAFFTAYYALCRLAALEEGERVLIHGGAGGVGLAAIQIAQWRKAEIFATAGSDEKREFLRLLGVDHVLDSRTFKYCDDVISLTNGAGVDIILNSLSGEAIHRNFALLKPFGRFLELGKRDFYENARIGLRPFRNNITYFGIDADQLMKEKPTTTREVFSQIMELFREGILHPLPYTCFDARNVVEAFRYMQQSQQIGKILVTYEYETPPASHRKAGRSRKLDLPADATYVVTGGLGGFGLRTAQWLVERGARHLALLGRNGIAGAESQQILDDLESLGVNIFCASCDVSDAAAVAKSFGFIAREMPPIRGIIHAAAVYDDALVRNTTDEKIVTIMAPKVDGALNLHEQSLSLSLDFFVMYSSATTLFGNPGQAAYVGANTALEAISRYRQSVGLPAVCLLWGPIDDVGFLSRNKKTRQQLLQRMGGHALLASRALSELEAALLCPDAANVAVCDIDWQAMRRFLPQADVPRYRPLARLFAHNQAIEGSAENFSELVLTLGDAELNSTLTEILKSAIGSILQVAPEGIDAQKSVYDMGLDSLMGVELSAAIEDRCGVRLPAMAVSDNPTIEKLAGRLAEIIKADPSREQESANEATAVAITLARQHAASLSHAEIADYLNSLAEGNPPQAQPQNHTS